MSKGTEAPARPRRVLVVGGSGMLAGFCRSLAHSGSSIFVLCRNSTKFKRNFVDMSVTVVQPIYTDYRDHLRLAANLTEHCATDAEFDDIIGWVHEEQSQDTPFILARFARRRYLAVLGSSADIPGNSSDFEGRMHAVNPELRISYAVLGFVKSRRAKARWLTDQEISEGVKDAYFSNRNVTVVGQVEPWSDRP